MVNMLTKQEERIVKVGKLQLYLERMELHTANEEIPFTKKRMYDIRIIDAKSSETCNERTITRRAMG